MSDVKIETGWKSIFKEEFEKEYWKNLDRFMHKERESNKEIFPLSHNIFAAYNLCPFHDVKVVILGQDPYHSVSEVNGKNIPTAHGLCFSVVKEAKTPPSLQNIFKELKNEYPGFKIPDTGNLEKWAEQGVLMINATLTVRAHEPMSHAKQGWEEFTDTTIKKISDKKDSVIFLLWGKHARAKKALIDQDKHVILEASHPSPFSAYNGFFGCNHFTLTNETLEKLGKAPIDWQT